MVYARKVGERTVTLRVSGMLWNRSLVMQDIETESLWSHILGKAMEGELAGRELDPIASVMTTWEDWKREHAETTVLAMTRTAKDYDSGSYEDPARVVLGVAAGGSARAYPFEVLRRTPVLEDEIGGEPVLVAFDPGSTRAAVFSRRLDGDTLRFSLPPEDGVIRDRRSGSEWTPLRGVATKGPLVGKRLEMLPAIVSFRRAWSTFHPTSTYFEAAAAEEGVAAATLIEEFAAAHRPFEGYMRALDDGEWKERFRTLRRLVLLGGEATEALVAALGHESDEVRILAAEALSFTTDPAARAALERAASEDGHAAVRVYAVDALAAIGAPDSRALLERLRKDDRNRDVRSHAGFALERPAAAEATHSQFRDLLQRFDTDRIDSAVVGKPAPDFTLETAGGEPVRLSSFRGEKAVVLVFIYGDT